VRLLGGAATVLVALCAASSATAAHRGEGSAGKLKPGGTIRFQPPAAGDVRVTVASITLRGRYAKKAPNRLKFRLGGLRRPTAELLAATKARRTRTSVTYTVILVGVNGTRERQLADRTPVPVATGEQAADAMTDDLAERRAGTGQAPAGAAEQPDPTIPTPGDRE